MAKNNFPQSRLDEVPEETVQQLVTSLKELHELGRPKTDEETKERIDEYFSFCERSSLRPGIESLCLALHITRTTLYRWANGQDRSSYRQELVQSAKGFIGAFIEQLLMSGKISPPSGIFLMKNWLSYKDAISIEESIPKTEDMEMLLALQSNGIDFSSNPYKTEDPNDLGYATYKANKNDPKTQQYAQYDREFYPTTDNRTLGLA